MDESAFMRLLERLSDAERYDLDAYGVYGTLPIKKHVHVVGKYGAVNRNGGLHSMLSGKLNRLVRWTKGCAKSVDMSVNLLALYSATSSMPLTIENTPALNGADARRANVIRFQRAVCVCAAAIR